MTCYLEIGKQTREKGNKNSSIKQKEAGIVNVVANDNLLADFSHLNNANQKRLAKLF